MKLIPSTMMLGLALASAAPAAPFNPAQVPAAATWVMHVDLDNLRQTAPGRALAEQLSGGKSGQQLDALAAVLGVDLRRDLTGFTLFGASNWDRDGVAVLRGRFDPARLEVLLKADPGYGVETYQGTALHTWIDREKNERRYGALLGDLALVSGSKAALQQSVDVVQARGASLAGQNPNQLPLPAPGSAFAVAAANLTRLPMATNAPNARTLRLARAGSFTLAEQGGQVVGRLSLRAERDESARLMADAARGLLAMAQLDEQQDAATRELLQSFRVEQTGSSVELQMGLPAEKAAVWLRLQMEKDAQKKAAEAAAVK